MRVRRVSLLCGIVSSLLYVALNVVGALQWKDYSSISQTISELAAIGAPSRPMWVLLGILYQLLMTAFGVGVWATAPRNRNLRVAGGLLIVYGVLGLTAPFFPMHLRGTLAGAESTLTDTMHKVLAFLTVLSMSLAIGFAAAAFGKRFRIYSIATIAMLVGFGLLAGRDAPQIEANLPTPTVGVAERICVGAFLLWVAVLAAVLLRGRGNQGAPAGAVRMGAHIDGLVTRGFEEVRAEFERNFAERGEIGAAVAAYWRGEKVVDLWGGRRTPTGEEPWNEDTMVAVNSTTKGLAALTVAVANSRGWIDYDAPVATYWPEFAQNGKGAITVRQLLSHEAGLVWIDEPLHLDDLKDLDRVARALARQKPAWEPGTRHGYHAMTIGLYMQELIRHVDPAHRTLGRFFQEEIAKPLQIDFYIGLPPEIPDARLAKLRLFSPTRALRALLSTPSGFVGRILWPWSLLRRSMLFADLDMNDRRSLEVEIPAGNGVGTARAIARAYSVFAEGGAELGIDPATIESLTAVHEAERSMDEVMGLPSWMSLGFLKPGPQLDWGSSRRAFGTPGAGGSFGFADPDARLGFAYVMNNMDFYIFDDPREKALRDAVYRTIARSK